MPHRRLLAAVLLCLVSACAGPSPLPFATSGQDAASLISAYRARRGLNPVVIDPTVTRAAAYQAGAIARAGTLSHTVGGSFHERMDAAGLRGSYSAENLGMGFRDFAHAFSYWQGSPAHDRNMLVPRFRRIGVAQVGKWWALVLAD